MNGDILRLVDAIHRDKSIEKSVIFRGIEEALKVAAQKRLDTTSLEINIDQESGELSATDEGEPIDPEKLGRIGAQTARNVMMKKIREAEYSSLYEKYKEREGEIVTGSVSRFSGPNMLVTVGKLEGFIPKSQQVRGENYQVGDRIRALIRRVSREKNKVHMELSRTDPKFIEKLFELEVPEITEGAIEIKKIVNKPGVRTKVAVSSNEEEIDAVGSCVGVRGSRIKGIVSELNNARVDIIEWDDDPQNLIQNSLKPAEVKKVELLPEQDLARAIVDDDELSVAIGKGGQNVQLACQLTGWEIDVRSKTIEEEKKEQEQSSSSKQKSSSRPSDETDDQQTDASEKSEPNEEEDKTPETTDDDQEKETKSSDEEQTENTSEELSEDNDSSMDVEEEESTTSVTDEGETEEDDQSENSEDDSKSNSQASDDSKSTSEPDEEQNSPLSIA